MLRGGECAAPLDGEGYDESAEFRSTALSIGEQVELIRMVLDRLCREFSELKNAIGDKANQEQQRTLF